MTLFFSVSKAKVCKLYVSEYIFKSRSSHRRCSIKKIVLKNLAKQENTCARACFLIKLQTSACNFIEKDTLGQVFSCEFFEIFKNTLFIQYPPGDCFCNSLKYKPAEIGNL